MRAIKNETSPCLAAVLHVTVTITSGFVAGETSIAWGSDGVGQTVSAGLSNVVAVVARDYHSVALRGDGAVAAWGLNSYGANDVPGNLTNAVAICGGLSAPTAIIWFIWKPSSHLRTCRTAPQYGAFLRPDVVLYGEILPLSVLEVFPIEQSRSFDLVFSIGATSHFYYVIEPVQI